MWFDFVILGQILKYLGIFLDILAEFRIIGESALVVLDLSDSNGKQVDFSFSQGNLLHLPIYKTILQILLYNYHVCRTLH